MEKRVVKNSLTDHMDLNIKSQKKRLAVIGGGAAGMLAAIIAAEQGYDVFLFEKNEKLGKKLFLTGKGRCNVTNACSMEELSGHVVTGSKFMYSSFYHFNNYDMMDFLEQLGVPLKIERGCRVFPASDQSSDVIRAMERELKRHSVHIMLGTKVTGLCTEPVHDTVNETNNRKKKKSYTSHICGIDIKQISTNTVGKEQYVPVDAVFVATGGMSYPATGSTGDGYQFARDTGHTVAEPVPSLVPLETSETFVKDLMGLSLKNISISLFQGERQIKHNILYSGFGEMLFTHFGVSGPLILTASSYIGEALKKGPLTLSIDLKPALDARQLDTRLLRDFESNRGKQFKHAFDRLLPKSLIPVFVELTDIVPEKKIQLITKEERLKIGTLLKDFRLTVTGMRGFNEAIITKGGVELEGINPKTMESKTVKGLYFIGEVLNADALTGGFNLQIAWSSAAAAAKGLKKDFT